VSDADLFQRHDDLQLRINQANIAAADPARIGPGVDVDSLEAERTPLAYELRARALDQAQNVYSPTDRGWNYLTGFMSTPMRRALTSQFLPDSIKHEFVQLAGDAGVHLHLNSLGQPTPRSVYQLSAQSAGESYRLHTTLVQNWADDTATTVPGAIQQVIDTNIESALRRRARTGTDYDTWLIDVNRMRVAGQTSRMSPDQLNASKAIDDYFEVRASELEATGLLNTKRSSERRVIRLEAELAVLRRDLAKATRAGANPQPILDSITDIEYRLTDQGTLKDGYRLVDDVEPFLPRYWNIGKIKENTDELVTTIQDWYRTNPYTFEFQNGRWTRVAHSTDHASTLARAKDTVQSIIDDPDPMAPGSTVMGYGRGRSLQSRGVDIPNSRVWDFIEQNPMTIAKNYNSRVMPQVHYRKVAGGSYDDVTARMRDQMAQRGIPEDQINATMRDYDHLYSAVVGSVVRDPSAINQKIAHVLRQLTSLTFLGAAGLTGVGDVGKIALMHELQSVFKGTRAILDPTTLKRTLHESRLAGAVLDMFDGMIHQRVVEDGVGTGSRATFLDKGMDLFYRLNLLGPVTSYTKALDGLITGHAIIDKANKIARGEATPHDLQWMLRHGISEEQAIRISRAPYQTNPDGLHMPNVDAWETQFDVPFYRDRRLSIVEVLPDGSPPGRMSRGRYEPVRWVRNELYFDRDYIEGTLYARRAWANPVGKLDKLPDSAFPTPQHFSQFLIHRAIRSKEFPGRTIDNQNRVSRLALLDLGESVQSAKGLQANFRSALNSSVMNTIMSATPADKPIIVSGVAHIPIRIGRMFGMTEDPVVKGYARIENGFMGLPFQFYNFLIASVNKTTGLMVQGQVLNRAVGLAAMLGAGYLTAQLKVDDRVWDNMSTQDRLARTIDYGGIIPAYSEMFYTGLNQIAAAGGPNATGGFLNPKYPQQPSAVDFATGLTGASSAWLANHIEGMTDIIQGEYGRGTAQILGTLPGSTLWFLRNEVRQAAYALRN